MSSEITNRNVYILGAGFSATAGAPLVHDFLDRSRELYDDPASGLTDDERKKFRSTFDFRRQMAQCRDKIEIDLDNIEQLFGLVEISDRLLAESANRNAETRSDIVYTIAKTLQLSIGKVENRGRLGFSPAAGCEGIDGIPAEWETSTGGTSRYLADLYVVFAALIAGMLDERANRRCRAETVITFNYDLVLDDALRRIGCEPNYYLGGTSSRLAERAKVSVPLLKLHGSTNWGICKGCKDILTIPPQLDTSPSNFLNLECPNCKSHSYQPMLVPPSWDKSEYRDVMRPIWQEAVEALKSASRICVIGYSMPEADSFFKFLLTIGLADNHQLYSFTVVDYVGPQTTLNFDEEQTIQPVRNPIETRYRGLLSDLFAKRRFQFSSQGFAFFMQDGGTYRRLGRGELLSNLNLY